MSIFDRLLARLRRADVAPIGTRLDARLSDDAKAARDDSALAADIRAFTATLPPVDVVGLDGVADLLGRIRAHVFDGTATAWSPDVLPDVSDTALPIVHEFLSVLEEEIPAHKWALRFRLADVAHRYRLDGLDGGEAG